MMIFPALASITNYPSLRGPFRWFPAYFIRHMENLAAPQMSAIVAADETVGARFAALNDKCFIVDNLPQELAPITPVPWHRRARAVAYVGTFTRWRGLIDGGGYGLPAKESRLQAVTRGDR